MILRITPLEALQPARSSWWQASRRRILPGLGGLIAGSFYAGASANAQQAFNGALSLDSIIQTQNNPTVSLSPDSPHLGPVQVLLGGYLEGTWDDNINTSQKDPQTDFIIDAGLNLGFDWLATPQSDLHLSTSLGYIKYLYHPANDSLAVTPGSALTWSIAFTDGSLTFFDQFNSTPEVISEASVSGVSSLPRSDNTVGVRAQWEPGRWLWELDGSYDSTFSSAAADQYLNSDSENFFFRGARHLADDTLAGLEVSAGLTTYQLSFQANNQSYSVGPYLEWQVTHFIKTSIHGGYTLYTFDSTGPQRPAQTLNSYYVNFTLTHQLTEFVAQTLSVAKSISPGLNQGNNYSEQLTAGYDIQWNATPSLEMTLNLTYEDGTQPFDVPIFGGLFTASESENYSRVGFRPGVSYQLTRKLSANLNYSHWKRTSNLAGNSYKDDSVSLEMNYDF